MPDARTGNEPRILKPGKRVYGATIGIAMMDRRFARPLGDIGNAATFDFPVIYDIVHGVIGTPSSSVQTTRVMFQPLYESCMRLVDQGVDAITTTAGYSALLQKELAAALPVRTASSSLLQLSMALTILPDDRKIGVIAARGHKLTKEYLLGAGVPPSQLNRVRVIDLQRSASFRDAILDHPGERDLRIDEVAREAVDLCLSEMSKDSSLGAFVAECTNVGPYSAAINSATGLPVWDAVSLVNWLHYSTATSARWGHQ